jgi:hypothetical protein
LVVDFVLLFFFFVFFTNARKKSDLFFSLSLSIRRERDIRYPSTENFHQPTNARQW